MSVCPVGTTPKALANGSGERNEDLARQCQRRRLSDREKLSAKQTDEVKKPLQPVACPAHSPHPTACGGHLLLEEKASALCDPNIPFGARTEKTAPDSRRSVPLTNRSRQMVHSPGRGRSQSGESFPPSPSPNSTTHLPAVCQGRRPNKGTNPPLPPRGPGAEAPGWGGGKRSLRA